MQAIGLWLRQTFALNQRNFTPLGFQIRSLVEFGATQDSIFSPSISGEVVDRPRLARTERPYLFAGEQRVI
jgi:hypothetical protein